MSHADPKSDAARYDPAAAGAMGDQSGGGAYPAPERGEAGRASGGQSDPGYSGPGRLAGADVHGTDEEDGADANAVAHGRDATPPYGGR